MTSLRPVNTRLDGRVALVTGGASGIGRASALAFAGEGARVVVADLDEAGGADTARLITAAGGEAVFVGADISRADEVEALIRSAVDYFGRLDCAHNNAGLMIGNIPLEEYDEELWDSIMAVNLKGTWLCLKYELAQMRAQGQGGGAIVNTASTLGLRGQAGAAAYTASKHGVIGLTRVAAIEGAAEGIRVNAVCPSWVRTPPMNATFAMAPHLEEQFTALAPIARLGAVEEVAAAVVWLCSDAAAFVTGQALAIDGGLTA